MKILSALEYKGLVIVLPFRGSVFVQFHATQLFTHFAFSKRKLHTEKKILIFAFMHTVEISSDKTYFVRKRKYSNAIILDAFNMKQENTPLLSLFYFSFH